MVELQDNISIYMGRRENYFSEHDAVELRFEYRLEEFRNKLLTYFRQNFLDISKRLNLVPDQAVSFNHLLTARNKDIFCFVRTMLSETPNENDLHYGYRINAGIGTSAELMIRWSTATDQPTSFLLDGLLDRKRVGRIKFLVYDSHIGEMDEEVVKREMFIGKKGKLVQRDRHYLRFNSLYSLSGTYYLFGSNCADRAFSDTIA